MADARRSEAWDHTAELLALVANVFSKKPIKSSVFHPFAPQEKAEADRPLTDAKSKANWHAFGLAFAAATRGR